MDDEILVVTICARKVVWKGQMPASQSVLELSKESGKVFDADCRENSRVGEAFEFNFFHKRFDSGFFAKF